MPGSTDLQELLRTLEVAIDPRIFVFITLGAVSKEPAGLQPIMRFEEAEGLTLIVERTRADRHGLEGIFPCQRLTLNVHSSLEAVGFIAFVAGRLAEAGIGTNPVAGYFHDHLFIAEKHVDKAVKVLRAIQANI